MSSKLFLHLICITFVSWQCAAIAPPSGGKKDTTPPELISATPPNGTVRLMEHVIELTFSEYMDEESFNDGIRIAPVLEGEPLIKYKGNRVIITIPDGIKNDMTVVLTLSRSIKDEHGVELAKPIQLAYSTGDIIESGVIKGRVYSSQPAAVYLFYEDRSDTLLMSSPNYISETEDDGSFAFNYLSSGKYKLLAIERGVAGLKLDQRRMLYGIPFDSGIELDSIHTGVRMRLFKEPELLRLLRGEWNDWYWGQLYFNNDFDQGLTIQDLIIGTQKMDWFHHPENKKSIVVTVSDSVRSKKEQIRFKHIKLDQSILLDSSSIQISIPTEVDTHYLALSSPETKLSITPDKSGPPINLVFTRPLLKEQLKNINIDLIMDDTISVTFNRKIESPMKMSIIPENGWEPKKSYQMKLFRQGSSFSKESFKDSIIVINIETTLFQGYGGLSGVVKGYESENLIAELISIENKEWKFKSVVNSEGQFEYKDIPESSYIFHIFDDRDQDKAYSYGKAFPFQTSEWFYFSPDTIEVRANWDIELQPLFMEK